MRDGRASPPPLPDFLQDENDTALVNRTLGTNYSLEQIQDAPELWLRKVLYFHAALNS